MPAEQFGATMDEWRRSRSCVGDGHCVELSVGSDAQVSMRNSTVPDKVLVFEADEWRNFIDAIKADELH